jgi:Holliday junction DNA helicase RuvA
VIGKIKGLVESKNTHQVVIDVNGLCYELEVPLTTAFSLPAEGDSIELYTHFVVREDAQLLYGFRSKADRDVFRILIKVNGVGPKLGIAILSGLSSSELSSCVGSQDVAALVKLPGIGKKTAERLLIELRDKLNLGEASSEGDSTGELLSQVVPQKKVEEEAEAALVALGYKPTDAAKMVKSNMSEGASVEDVIKGSLRSLN